MKQPKILIVGSFVMDQIGTTSVFPREGQTVFGKEFYMAPGGKGANQAVQCARLGAQVTMIGKVGADSNGQKMLEACAESGVRTDSVLVDPTLPTGCSMIILEEAEDGQRKNRILVLPGANMSIRPAEMEFLEDQIGQYDMVILQLEIPMEINVQVAKYAHAKGVPVMLNSAPSAPLPEELLACLTYISPNEHEAQDLTGVEIAHEKDWIDEAAVIKAANILSQKGVENVLITLGSAGAAMVSDGAYHMSPAVKNVHAVDPTAAGDSFVGAFCVAVCSGLEPEQAMCFANHTAALTVSRMGAMPSLPTAEEVRATLPDSLAGCL